MTVHSIQAAIRTHQGYVRKHNQDSLRVDSELGVMVLADGMGGHRSGEVASRVAVEAALADLLPTQREDAADGMESLLRVGHSVEVANQALLDMCEVHPELKGMGTTLVLAIFREGRIYHAHIGDSRLYRVRYGRLRRLTRDHSLIQRMIDDGVFVNRSEAREAGVKENVLTRSLGMQPQTEVHFVENHMAPSGIGEPGVPPIAPVSPSTCQGSIAKRSSISMSSTLIVP